jgi:hypothetical protein
MFNLWFFLSTMTVFGSLLVMLFIYLNHKEVMKKLELEAVKNNGSGSRESQDNKIQSN